MKSRKVTLLPSSSRIMKELGENIKLARLRRKLSMEQVAERANMSRPTLSSIEHGSPSVCIGSYLNTLLALGLEKDFLKVASDDILGRKLQDAGLLIKKRAGKKKK